SRSCNDARINSVPSRSFQKMALGGARSAPALVRKSRRVVSVASALGRVEPSEPVRVPISFNPFFIVSGSNLNILVNSPNSFGRWDALVRTEPGEPLVRVSVGAPGRAAGPCRAGE